MCGAKVIPNDHGERHRLGEVLSAGKTKICGSRFAEEDTQDWEAAFRQFMAEGNDDDDEIEQFLSGLFAQH